MFRPDVLQYSRYHSLVNFTVSRKDRTACQSRSARALSQVNLSKPASRWRGVDWSSILHCDPGQSSEKARINSLTGWLTEASGPKLFREVPPDSVHPGDPYIAVPAQLVLKQIPPRTALIERGRWRRRYCSCDTDILGARRQTPGFSGWHTPSQCPSRLPKAAHRARAT